MKFRVLAASLLVLPVGFCTHTKQPPPLTPSTFCQIARPITWEPNDSRITKQQVDAHNKTWKRLCKK